MGRPFVNVAFTKGEDKDTFNRIEPTQDRELFTKKFADLLESFGHSTESAHKMALTLLPDILEYDYTSSKGYPNGRKLTDDIIDIQLAVLTNGRVTTDKVGPHQDLLATFPYLGSPHTHGSNCCIIRLISPAPFLTSFTTHFIGIDIILIYFNFQCYFNE